MHEVDCWRALALALPQRGLEFEREEEIPIAFDRQMTTRRGVDFVISNDDEKPLQETKGRRTMPPEGVEQSLLCLHQGYHRVCAEAVAVVLDSEISGLSRPVVTFLVLARLAPDHWLAENRAPLAPLAVEALACALPSAPDRGTIK